MGWTKYGILIAIFCIIAVVSIFGSQAGYTVDGVPKGATEYVVEDTDNPWIPNFIENILDTVGESFGFLWDMLTFQIDGMPVFINFVFIGMSLVVLLILVSLIRGTA